MSGKNYQVVIVFNLEKRTTHGEAKDLIALGGTSTTTNHLYHAMQALGERVSKMPVSGTLDSLRDQLSHFSQEDTFVFNNCDGFNGINTGSVDVTRVIEEMGFEHSGAPAEAIRLCTDKIQLKEILSRAGIPTPNYQVFEKTPRRLQLTMPVIVKPAREDGSVGIELVSVANDAGSALKRIAYIIERYHQPALVEEFIDGRELNAALWGNNPTVAMPIAEQDYSRIRDPLKRLLTYASKWEPDSFYYKNIPVICPAKLTPDENMSVEAVAKLTYEALGLRDYGRIDLRLKDGIPWVIDVNDIPDLSPDSGFPNTAIAAGYDYNSMVRRLLDVSLQRVGWK
jgi:D-alanine-D-alanine ligase